MWYLEAEDDNEILKDSMGDVSNGKNLPEYISEIHQIVISVILLAEIWDTPARCMEPL